MVRDKTEEHLQGGARRGRAKRPVSIHWHLGLPQEAGKQQWGGEDSGYLGQLLLPDPACHCPATRMQQD